ncbi:glycosyltransferase family 4 protein [Demequina lutea]|uniref:D-inositol 3-phosphate glycosyltransferase n=1 Tax=Demequina lutea TaxID=431489 RepID=A0A7Y9Z9E0_9MICO|nr:glycosyltransferase family 4 protein [Demequina lutea]NYI40428.1 glycosyltransferase involved in cell wall biosynthesis [Demequina lutea]
MQVADIEMNHQVLVVNAGNHPEPQRVATGLIAVGWDCTYMTATMWPSDHWLMQATRMKPFSQTEFASNLRRRVLPSSLTSANTVGLVRTSEVVAQLARRFAPAHTVSTSVKRTTAFRKSAARRSAASSIRPEVVLAQYTSALEVFEQDANSTRILMYPIAHHEWMRRSLNAEAARAPQWAEFLQGNDIDAARREAMDREIGLADAVIVPSNFVQRTFVESGIDPAKIRVLNLGVDLKESAAVPLASPSGSSVPLKLLFVGQVNQRKGIGHLLEALDLLDPQKVHLDVIGPATPNIEKRIRRDYPGVSLHGTMPRFKVKQAMAKADVLVLPSLAEGFALVGLEAMSVATPTLVTAETGIDVIEDGLDGWVIPRCDRESIAQTIDKVLAARDELPQISARAQAKAMAFSWDKYSARAVELVVSIHEGPSWRVAEFGAQ